MSLRELGHPPALEAAVAYLDLLAEQKPERSWSAPACAGTAGSKRKRRS